MKLSTTSYVDEDKYDIIGIAHGASVRSFSFFRQFIGAFRGIFGGRAGEFEEKMLEAWSEAVDEMIDKAKKIGAIAIYGIDIDISEISMGGRDGMIVIGATGTAVRKKGSKNKRNNTNRRSNKPQTPQTAGRRKKTKRKTSKTTKRVGKRVRKK